MSTAKIIKGILLLGWCALIFYLSASDGRTSQAVSDGFLHLIFADIPEYTGVFIRKMAHFSEYMILALLAYAFFCEFTTSAACFTFFFGCFYAVSDEFHQLFVQGRSAQLPDVLIDVLGVCAGLLIVRLFHRRKECFCRVKKR